MYLIKKISIVILIFFLFNNFAPSQVKIKFSDNCLTKLVIEERNLTNYLMKYNVSVKSVDLKNNYSYSYNESKIYYAASTIKMLSAIYFYDRAMKKEIDLDTTMKYEVKYKKNASKGMDKEKINTEISLRNLIKVF